MKKILGITAVLVLVLTACGGTTTSYKGEETTTDDKGAVTVTTITYDKTGNDISNVKISSTKDGVDKSTDAYGLTDATANSGKSWAKQAEAVQTYIENNDKFPALGADGKATDTASGATITLSGIESVFNSATEVK